MSDGPLEVAVTSFGPPLTNGRISRLCRCTWRQNEPVYSVLEHCEGKTGIMVFQQESVNEMNLLFQKLTKTRASKSNSDINV